jgi:AcrR family transcriptional regulator
MSPETRPLGLRERKAIKIRQRITEVAMALFRERGFDGATLAEIAEAAEVAPRTLSNYFGSKEALVFAWQDAGGDRLLERIAAGRVGEDPFTVAVNAVYDTLQDTPHDAAASIARMIADTPVLRARDQLKTNALEIRLSNALRAREPALPELEGRLIAMIVLGAYRVAETLWLQSGSQTRPGRYIEQTFARLRTQVARSIAAPRAGPTDGARARRTKGRTKPPDSG